MAVEWLRVAKVSLRNGRATKRQRNGVKTIWWHCVKIQFATGDTFNVFVEHKRAYGRSVDG